MEIEVMEIKPDMATKMLEHGVISNILIKLKHAQNYPKNH